MGYLAVSFYDRIFQKLVITIERESQLSFWVFFNLFEPSFAFHAETSLWIFIKNEMAGFCMKCNTAEMS